MNTKFFTAIAVASAQPFGRIAYAEIQKAAKEERDLCNAYALLCCVWNRNRAEVKRWCERVQLDSVWVAECVKRGDTFTEDGRRIPREIMMDK